VRSLFGLLAVGCLLSAVSAQWLETEIQLPDSLSGIWESIRLVCDTADNRILVGGENDDYVIVIDAQTNAKIARIPMHDGVRDLLYVPELRRVYCTSKSRRFIYVIDPRACVIDDSVMIPVFTGYMAYSPSANKLYSTLGSDKAIRVVDCAQGSYVRSIGLQDDVGQMCWVPSVNKLYCLQVDSGRIAAIDCTGDSLLGYINVGPVPRCLLHSPLSGRLYCSLYSIDSLAIIDPFSDSVVRRIGVSHKPGRLGLNPVLNQVYCSSVTRNEVSIISGQGDTVIGTMVLPNAVSSFSYDPLDSAVLALDNKDWLRIIDVRNNEYLDSMYVGSDADKFYDSRTSLFYTTRGRTVSVFDVPTRSPVAQIELGIRTSGVCWCPVGNKLYCATGVLGDTDVATVVIDCESNRTIGSVPTPEVPERLVYNPLHNKMYVANGGYQESTLTVIDCYGDTVVARAPAGISIVCMCYSPGYDEVYTGDGVYTHGVYVVDCSNDSVVAALSTRLFPVDLAWCGRQKAVYVACSYDGYVQAIDCATHQITADIPTPGRPQALLYWPEGNLMFVALKDSDQVAAIDCRTNQVVARIPVGYSPASLVLASDFGEVYCGNSTGHDVTVIACSTLTPVATIDVRASPTLLAYDSIAGRVYCVCWVQSVLSVVDCRSHSLATTIALGDGANYAAWSPASRRLYVSNNMSTNLSVIRDTAVLGTEEPRDVLPSNNVPLATVVRGVLNLSKGTSTSSSPSWLLDAAGRKALDLKAGANDLSALAPGVYFVTVDGVWNTVSVRKVIVTE